MKQKQEIINLESTSLLLDTTLEYPGYHNCKSKCRLRIYQQKNRVDKRTTTYLSPVVIVSEEKDNTGTSITNCAEYLATLVLKDYTEYITGDFIWIEHYPHEDSILGGGETFSLVQFNFDINSKEFSKPRWSSISVEAVKLLIGIDDNNKYVQTED